MTAPVTADRSLIARTSAVSAATLGSRVLGFARDVGTAAILGAGPLADALMAALSLPLLARRLLAEGALNAALLPALAKAEDRAAAVANATFVLLTTVLLALTLAGVLAMSALMLVLAPGFSADGERADLAVACGRIALLYLPLAGAAAVLAGIANGAGRVLLPALAPMAGNAVVLAVIGVLLMEGLIGTPAAALAMAACAVMAGIAQLSLMILAVRGAPALDPRAGFAWRAARGVMRAAGPALLFAGLPQVRVLLVAAMVSAVPGAVSALNYAQRLIDLPLGLVGASAGAVLVPLLASGRGGARGAETARAALAALAFALPAGVGLLTLAEPIISVLYQRASFTAEDTAQTAALLAVLALALPLQGLEKVLCAAALSHGLSRQAERTGLVSLVLALLVAAVLGFAVGPAAAAGGIAVSAGFAVARLGFILMRGGHLRLARDIWLPALGLLAASGLMAGVVTGIASVWPAPSGTVMGGVRLAVLVLSGMVTYGLVALAVRRRAGGAAARD